MSPLDKIIFISILLNLLVFPGVDELRVKAFKDLDNAIIAAFDSTVRYVLIREIITSKDDLW